MLPSAPEHRRTRRMFAGAALGLVAVLGLGGVSAASYLSAVRWVDHSIEVRGQAYRWLTALLDEAVASRQFVVDDRPGSLDAYEGALAQERATSRHIRTLVSDNATQIKNVEATERAATIVTDRLGELVKLAKGGRRDVASSGLAATDLAQAIDAFRLHTHRVRLEEERLLTERRAHANVFGWATALGAIVIALISSGLFATAWRREMAHQAFTMAFALGARRRLALLTELATALSNVRTRSQVADTIVEQGMRAAGADTCTLYVLDETGTALELIGDRGIAPELLHKIRRITATSGNPEIFAALKAGKAEWVENEAEYATLHPTLANMKARRAKAFWGVPLVAEDRVVGLLGAGFYEAKRFSDDDRQLVETITKQCAQALVRASRLEREEQAHRWLATILRSIGDAVIATDAEGRVTFMNSVAERLTGWEEGEARGRPLDDVFCIYSENTRSAVESPVTKVLREGKVVGLANHTRMRSKHGVEIPIDDSGAPIRTEDGRIVGVVLVFRDATNETRERARGEFLAKAGEALVSSRDYEATLVTVAQLAVPALADWCAVDLVAPDTGLARQVAVAHADPSKVQFARELGARYPPDPQAQTGTPQVIRTGKPELYPEIPQALLEAGAKDEEHLKIIRGLQLDSAIVVPLGAHGRTFGAMTFIYAGSGRRYTNDDLGFAEDFARRAAMAIENALVLKDAEEARAKEHWLRGEAEIASRAKDDFLATVSHELRTPLNAILGWTVMLRKGRQPPEVERALVIIERNARAQAKLLEDVLDVSRIISGKLALTLGPTRVAHAVFAAIETVTPAADAKDIAIETQVADDTLVITADADRLQQIVWNLLTNAVKFTPKGGRVSVEAYREGSHVCICVSDTGEGIRPDILPLIFDAFQQADASTTRRHGGLGLGLAIVKQLVVAHGGSVEAHSAGIGKGARFVIQLPARAAVSALGRTSRTSAASDASETKSAPRIDGLRVLVVDDEEDALALVAEVLRQHGAEVYVTSSAREAMQHLISFRPDVLVSDIGMPDMDGYSLIQQIRALDAEAGGGTPAVALTAYARGEDAQRAYAAGYQMHLTKPVDPAQLATVVASLGRPSMTEG